MPTYGCYFSLQLTFLFPGSSLGERGTAKMIYSMKSVFWVLKRALCSGSHLSNVVQLQLVLGSQACPRWPYMSPLSLWQQADLGEKTESVLLRAMLAPNNEEFSFWTRVSVHLPQQVPEFLHNLLGFLVYPGLTLFNFGVVPTEEAPEEICFNSALLSWLVKSYSVIFLKTME